MLNDLCSDPEYLLCFCVRCLLFPLQRTGTTFAALLSAGTSPVIHEASEITSTVCKFFLVMLGYHLSGLANMRASSLATYYVFSYFSIPAWDRILLVASITCASPVLAVDLFSENQVKEPLNTSSFPVSFIIPPCWATEIILSGSSPVSWFQLPPATKAQRGRPSPCRRAEENEKKEAETGGSG